MVSSCNFAHRTAGVLRRGLCALLSVMAAIIVVPVGSVRAELVSTGAAVADQASAERAVTARTEVSAFLGRADVRAQLAQLGVPADEATARVAALSDAEVLQIQDRIAELPAGGSFLELVASLLVLTVLVLVVTDLLAYTDVFPFISPLETPRS
jgi:hypothetical protein